MYLKRISLYIFVLLVSNSYLYSKDFRLIKIIQNSYSAPTIYFSPNDKYFVYKNKSGATVLCNFPSLKIVKTFFDQYIYDIDISFDNKFCAIAVMDKNNSKIKIFELSAFKLIKILNIKSSIFLPKINFSKNGLFFEVNAGEISKLYLTPNFKLVKTFVGSNNRGYEKNMDYSKSGKYYVGINSNFAVIIYDLNNFNLIDNIKISENKIPQAVYFSPDEKYIIVQTEDFNINEIKNRNNMFVLKPQNVQIYSFPEIHLVRTLKNQSSIIRCVFSPESKYFASVDQIDNFIKIYSTFDFKLKQVLNDHEDIIRSIKFSNNGNYFASGGQDNKINIYIIVKK